MTYLILVLVEDERRSLSVEPNSMTSSINMLTRRTWHDEDMRVEDGRMSSECAVKRWRLLADFAIP